MIESIKNELYKSLHNKLFAISMIIAFIIQIFSVQPNAAFKNEALEHYLTTSSMGGVSNKVFFESFDIYTFWIGIEGVSMGCYLSKYLIPILAVLQVHCHLYLRCPAYGIYFAIQLRCSGTNLSPPYAVY